MILKIEKSFYIIVKLFTKDQNKVSELDEQMAKKINKLL